VARPLKVLVLDQTPAGTDGLKLLLKRHDIEIVGEAGMGRVARLWARLLEPDLIVIGASEPLVPPLTTIRILTHGATLWTMVAVAAQFDGTVVRDLLVAGATDVLSASAPPVDVYAALMEARRIDLQRRTTQTGKVVASAAAG
jgi:DNA-binding NarL/FixJ family response regulator